MSDPPKSSPAVPDFDAWRAAMTAQQLVKAASALESRVSGLVSDAPLHVVQETATIAHTLSVQISELLLTLLPQIDRVLVVAEQKEARR